MTRSPPGPEPIKPVRYRNRGQRGPAFLAERPSCILASACASNAAGVVMRSLRLTEKSPMNFPGRVGIERLHGMIVFQVQVRARLSVCSSAL